MSVKALGTALKLTFEGKNQLIYPETWFFMLVVTTCVITQMNYLNKVRTSLAIFLCLYPFLQKLLSELLSLFNVALFLTAKVS